MEGNSPTNTSQAVRGVPVGCDAGFVNVHAELLRLHAEKSATYGHEADRFRNFTALGAVQGKTPERYVVERIIEKCVRALNMIDAGQAADVREYPDIANLGIVAESLRRRAAS